MPGDPDPEIVGDVSAALCTDPAWASVTFNLAAAVAGATTSADASYGSAACPGRFLVDLDNTTNKSFSSWADWGDTAPTQSGCGSRRVTAHMDGLLPPSSGYPQGRWVSLYDRTAVGVWSAGVCRLRADLETLQGATPYTKVRIAARASAVVGGDFSQYQVPAKVSVGFKQYTPAGR
jgi:hypothetical protein